MRTAPSCIENCGAEICPFFNEAVEEMVKNQPAEVNYQVPSVQAEEVLMWLKRYANSPDALPMTPRERQYLRENPTPSDASLCASKIYTGVCAKYGWTNRTPQRNVEIRPRLRLIE